MCQTNIHRMIPKLNKHNAQIHWIDLCHVISYGKSYIILYIDGKAICPDPKRTLHFAGNALVNFRTISSHELLHYFAFVSFIKINQIIPTCSVKYQFYKNVLFIWVNLQVWKFSNSLIWKLKRIEILYIWTPLPFHIK